METQDKIKNHFKRNAGAYVTLVGVCVLAGITTVIMRERSTRVAEEFPLGVQRPPKNSHWEYSGSNFFSNSFNKDSFNVINVIEREGRGHPGYLTRCLETGLTYKTQAVAAREHGLSPTKMSNHLNGMLDHVGGYHFDRILVENDGSH